MAIQDETTVQCALNAAPSLYVVATPIGNMGDITHRARSVLASVDKIAAEDTRNTARLLSALGLHKPLMAHHAHNEEASAQGVVACLQRGESVALVCDAGTPCVSDPGAVVVAAVLQAGFAVVPIPGASSVLAAVCASGLVRGAFTFRGFLPSKGKERLAQLQACLALPEPQVLFEAPHRVLQLVDELESLAQEPGLALATRPLCAGRELTKQFETFYRGHGAQVWQQVRQDPHATQGEWVWVLAGALPLAAVAGQGEDPAWQEADRWLQAMLNDVPLKTAVAMAVKATGLPRNAVYKRALGHAGQGGNAEH